MKKKFFVCIISTLFIINFASAAEYSQSRIDNSLDVLAMGVDKLLIDTEHVYVNPKDKVEGFYLPGTGAILIGQISMTAFGDHSFFSQCKGSEKGKESILELKLELGDLEEDLTILSKDLKELAKVLSKLPENEQLIKFKKEISEMDELRKLTKLAKWKGMGCLPEITGIDSCGKEIHIIKKKYHQQMKSNVERIENMDKHLDAFKKELIATVFDFGPVLKIASDEQIIITFFIKEKAFEDKFGSSKLVLRIPYETLMIIQNLNPDDPKVQEAFYLSL